MEHTPLYDALTAFAARDPLRMHMPGHKGKPLLGLDNLATIDFTELPPTGNLFDGGGAIGEAEGLWAEAFGMDSCLFLTGGSTQGVLAALTLACRPGDRVLLDRGSHRSAYNALALLDLKPVYLDRPWLDQAGVTGPVSPERVEELLESNPEIKALWVTCPKWFSSLIYISMGWVCVLAMQKIIQALPGAAFGWLLAGGVIYTIGGVIYALKLPIFNSRHKNFGSHEIFHLFVMGGSLCHYIVMYQFVA